MIGLLFLGIGIVGSAAYGIQQSVIESQNIDKAKKNGQDWYFDAKGRMRETSTGRRIIVGTESNGDTTWRDADTWKIIRNISQEKREQNVWVLPNGKRLISVPATLEEKSTIRPLNDDRCLYKYRELDTGRIVCLEIYLWIPRIDENGNLVSSYMNTIGVGPCMTLYSTQEILYACPGGKDDKWKSCRTNFSEEEQRAVNYYNNHLEKMREEAGRWRRW